MNVLLKYDDIPDLNIHNISVIGSFNEFDSQKNIMKKDGNVWTYETELPEGEYLYKFMINDGIQLNDPYNNLYEQDKEERLSHLKNLIF